MKKKLFLLFPVLLIFFFPSVVYPKNKSLGISSHQRSPQREKIVKLDEFIKIALENNPQIQAAEKRWQATKEIIPQARSLPDPMISYTHFGRSIETKLGPQRNKISISQKFPFFGKLSLKGQITQKQANSLEEQYKAVKKDIILKVKKAYYDLYWINKSIEITQKEKEVLQRLEKIAEKKYETGTASQQDVLKAQVEISKIIDKLLLLNQQKKAIKANLNALLNRPADSFIGEPEDFEISKFNYTLEELYKMAKENRPELRSVFFLIEKNKAAIKLAKKNYYPDFALMFSYVDIGGGTTMNPEDGSDSWMGSIGINIPIWRKKLHAGEEEAINNLKASERNYKDIENNTLSQVNELYFEVKTAEEVVKLYKYSLLPQAEQSFKASEAGYLTGKVDFLNLLDSERMLLHIKIGYFKSMADFEKSLAQLERVVGTDLIRKL
ncbi:MAG: TolC family protein [Candidatus Aminicenantia bacterium]